MTNIYFSSDIFIISQLIIFSFDKSHKSKQVVFFLSVLSALLLLSSHTADRTEDQTWQAPFGFPGLMGSEIPHKMPIRQSV